MSVNSAEVQYREGYEYGMGVVASTGMRANKAVRGEVSGFEGAEGGAGSLQLFRLESTSDAEDALDISASASGGIGCFSASGRFNFAKNCKVHSHAINLLVVQKIAFGFEQIDNPVLTEEAGKIVDKPDLFQTRYGELFCAGVTTGGLFYGSLQITYQSEKSRQDIEASMSGSYGLAFTAEVAMRLQSALQRTSSAIDVHVYNEGGSLGESFRQPQSTGELLEVHTRWYNSIIGDGTGSRLRRPYKALLLPLTICEGPLPPNKTELDHQRDVLMYCAQLRSETYDKLNLVSHMLAKQGLYEWHPGTISSTDLNALRSKLARDIDQIARAAVHAVNSPKEAKLPENIPADNSYAFTVLPVEKLPQPRGANVTEVPDLSHARNLDDVKLLLVKARLTSQIVSGPSSPDGFAVQQQLPPAGRSVPTDSIVTVVVQTAEAVEPPFARKFTTRQNVHQQLGWGGLNK